jgi:hypothetical protein
MGSKSKNNKSAKAKSPTTQVPATPSSTAATAPVVSEELPSSEATNTDDTATPKSTNAETTSSSTDKRSRSPSSESQEEEAKKQCLGRADKVTKIVSEAGKREYGAWRKALKPDQDFLQVLTSIFEALSIMFNSELETTEGCLVADRVKREERNLPDDNRSTIKTFIKEAIDKVARAAAKIMGLWISSKISVKMAAGKLGGSSTARKHGAPAKVNEAVNEATNEVSAAAFTAGVVLSDLTSNETSVEEIQEGVNKITQDLGKARTWVNGIGGNLKSFEESKIVSVLIGKVDLVQHLGSFNAKVAALVVKNMAPKKGNRRVTLLPTEQEGSFNLIASAIEKGGFDKGVRRQICKFQYL